MKWIQDKFMNGVEGILSIRIKDAETHETITRLGGYAGREFERHAALIAAAPDLLQAAKDVADKLDAWKENAELKLRRSEDSYPDSQRWRNERDNYAFLIDLLRAAIVKAEE